MKAELAPGNRVFIKFPNGNIFGMTIIRTHTDDWDYGRTDVIYDDPEYGEQDISIFLLEKYQLDDESPEVKEYLKRWPNPDIKVSLNKVCEWLEENFIKHCGNLSSGDALIQFYPKPAIDALRKYMLKN